MKRPKVGVGVFIRQGNCILLGLRKGKHASGTWSNPGGHLEGGESFEQCALRETEEETGIILPAARLWWVENNVYYAEQKHYVVVSMIADMPAGQEACVTEPSKCERWGWFPWGQLPSPLLQGVARLVALGLNPAGAA